MAEKDSLPKNGKITLKDIAAKLGISKGAVSLAMNDSKKISKETKLKVVKTAKEMGYRQNAIVSNLMSSMKASGSKDFLETIVLINANKNENATSQFPIFARYVKGITSEAEKLGYSIYRIWLYDKTITPKKLRNILESRAIRGGVIIGHADDNVLPEIFADIWANFKFVSAGIRTYNPFFDFISADKFLIAHHATQTVIERGYKRPSIVLDKHTDELVEGRFAGGFLSAQLALPWKDRIPPFLDVQKARKNPQVFFDWIKKHNPDAIFSISSTVSEWLESGKISSKIPRKISLIEFEKKTEKGDWIGMDQNYETVGRLAVIKLFNILNTPVYLRDAVPTATIVPPKWNTNTSL